MESLIGKVVDNYSISQVLGKGGMGIVYKAKDMNLDRDVALKMMDAMIARDQNFLKRFQSEAKALAKLHNPSIVTVFALRETEFGLFIVMEFVEGGTLADRLSSGEPIPLHTTFNIFKQILSALDHAHKVGIIHRDIKPSNIMLTGQDVVKVTDFGLAKIQQPSAVTMTVGTGGTLFYMSPEQVRGLANVDHRGDVYSLGMTLYETLARRLPFSQEDTDFSIRQAIVEGNIPPPDRFKPDLPKDLVKIVMKSIEKDPANRYQSAAEMWNALDGVSVKEEVGKGRTTVDKEEQGKSAKWKPVAYLVALGTIVAASYWAIPELIPPSTPTLAISSIPAGANVFLNGRSVGVTPLDGYEVSSGTATLRVTQPGFYPNDTSLYIADGDHPKIFITLGKVSATTTLTVRTSPTGAIVLVGDEVVGVSPMDSYSIRPGFVALRVEREGYSPRDTNLVIDEGENPTITLTLNQIQSQSAATLILQVLPSGSISVDGAIKSSNGSQAQTVGVAAGVRTVLFKHPEYGTKEVPVPLEPNQTKTLTCYFESYVSIQSLNESNEPLWGTIVVDGENTGEITPRDRYPLKPGKHVVTVSRTEYQTVEGSVQLVITPTLEETVHRLVFHLRKK